MAEKKYSKDDPIEVGDVYRMEAGEGLRIEEFDYPDGQFLAQIRSIATGEWSEYELHGQAIKLPSFLEQYNAVKE